MKTNRLIWALGWVTMGSLAALQGCGGDDDDAGTGGKGSGGSGGKATGGSAGKATGGSAGKATGGSAGKATGGTSGSSGTSGAGGAPGGEGGEGGAGVDPLRYPACQGYCQAYQDAQCFDAAADTYGDEPTCRDTCMEADWPIGAAMAAAGDSIICRTTHAGLALAAMGMQPNETHCGHASENPTGVCVD